ncbi:MAG: acyltransferase [Calditrichaeota bacterium]|nr:MAG: acyltransferase [Calditrichota bacterium]
MNSARRYDIDWLRVVAIALLLIYHIVLIFQPWARFIGFIQSEESSSAIWVPMALLNVWRIPLLFLVSGMGVCFALRKRDWKQLLLDRAKRILLPLVFGSFFIVPIHNYFFQNYYDINLSYTANVGHLWFLGNICIYISQIIGFAFLDRSYNYKFFNGLRGLLNRPYFLYLFIIPFIIEAELTNPEYFSLYVGTTHGFFIGMLAFFTGFLFVAIGDAFWYAVEKIKLASLAIAAALFLVRYLYFEYQAPHFLTSIESMNWIFAVLGFGCKYLNKPSKILSYLSQAAYPVYIIHMAFLFWAASLILPHNLPLAVNLILINAFTFAGCFLSYHFIIRKFTFLRPLFGLLSKKKEPSKATSLVQ